MDNSNSNMPVTNLRDVPALAIRAYKQKRFLSLYGKAGVGKSSMKDAIAEEAQRELDLDYLPEVFFVNFSAYSTMEVVGYGVPEKETKELWFSKNMELPHYSEVGDKVYVFVLDEFNSWDKTLQAMCHSLLEVNDGGKHIGSHRLGDNGIIVTTGNRRCDGATTSVPRAPVVTRALSVAVEPEIKEGIAYFAGKGLNDSIVFQYLGYKMTHDIETPSYAPPCPSPWDGEPYPTPRGWEAALGAALGKYKLDRIDRLEIAGYIGKVETDRSPLFVF